MKLLRPLEYVYYRLYMWDLRVGAKWGYSAEIYAWAQLSTLFLLNIWGVLGTIELFTGWHLARLNNSLVFALGLVFAVLTVVYFVMVYRGRYHRFVKEFSAETSTQRRIRSAGILVYVIISFALFCGFLFSVRPV